MRLASGVFGWFRATVILVGGMGLLAPAVARDRIPLVWPTPNHAFIDGEPLEDYIQPTASGRIESGLYGCTRNGGKRFHEGVDLKAVERDRRGRATDPIFAAMPGEVVHVNKIAGNSSYGIYVVLAHDYEEVRFYTLYSHLASVAAGIVPGKRVGEGEVLGIMGSTAGGYTIPRSRAHLHFEIGLRLTDDFAWWYDAKGFGSVNTHGSWNGMNLVGVDPLEFYRLSLDGKVDGLRDFLLREPVAVRVRVPDDSVPDLARRSPGLVEGSVDEPFAGWDVDFNAYGVPIRLRTVPPQSAGGVDSGVTVIGMDAERAFPSCKDLVEKDGDRWVPGADVERALELMFGR